MTPIHLFPRQIFSLSTTKRNSSARVAIKPIRGAFIVIYLKIIRYPLEPSNFLNPTDANESVRYQVAS